MTAPPPRSGQTPPAHGGFAPQPMPPRPMPPQHVPPQHPAPPRPGPQGGPSAATAIIGAVLALAGACWELLAVADGVVALVGLSGSLSHFGSSHALGQVVGTLLAALTVCLLAGGGLSILLRKRVGSVLAVAGCVLAIVGHLAAIGLAFVGVLYLPHSIGLVYFAPTAPVTVAVTLVLLVFPVATAALVSARSTKEWIAAVG